MSATRLIEMIEPRLLMASVQVITETFVNPGDPTVTQDASYWRVEGNTGDGIADNLNDPTVNDAIVVKPSADNTMLEAYLNGTLLGSIAKGTVRGVELVGLQGFDTLTVETTPNADLTLPAYQIDVPAQFKGGKGNDVITGGPETSIINGGRGDDTISGGDGRDVIRGGFGNDTIAGNDGRDSVFGGQGADSIQGGRAGDTLLGGDGNDTIFGGTDNDLIAGGPNTGADPSDVDALFGGPNNDTVYANSAEGDVTDNDGSNPTDIYFTTPLTGTIQVKTHFSISDLASVTGEEGLRDLNRQFDLHFKISSFLFDS